jgi:hypothetical protein
MIYKENYSHRKDGTSKPFYKETKPMRLGHFRPFFFSINSFSKWKHGTTNFSGQNLNIGIYDNDLKGVGQDAEVIYGSSGL